MLLPENEALLFLRVYQDLITYSARCAGGIQGIVDKRTWEAARMAAKAEARDHLLDHVDIVAVATTVSVTIAGRAFARYSEGQIAGPGLRSSLGEWLQVGASGGHIWLDDTFWTSLGPPRKWQAGSGKLLLGDGQFLFNGEPFGCWLNLFSGDDEWDTAHAHSHDELLIQLAGYTSYSLLPRDDDAKHVVSPGEVMVFPAGREHAIDVYNCNTDSLTLSIKRVAETRPR